jgi:hypothetical protein
MPSKIDLLLEAERRGILPPKKASLLEEAKKRGLVPGTPRETYDNVGGDIPLDIGATSEEMSDVYRPALEYGGLAAGATVGAPLGPAGAVGGAGLGYGMGRSIADLLDEWAGLKDPLPLEKRLKKAGADVVVGGAMEGGGQLLVKGVTAGAKAVAETPLAKRLYSSALKMPLSKKWVKARGEEQVSNITKAVRKGIDESIPPSEYGLEVTKLGKSQAASDIDAAVSKMTGTHSTVEILESGLKRAVDAARKGEAPARDLDKIAKYADDLMDGRGTDLTPVELNDLKKKLYDLVNFDKLYGKADSLVETIRKGLAHEARMQLQASNPALKELNADYASWRLLEEALAQSLARHGNRDLFSLGTKVLIGRQSWPLAIFNQTVGHPRVKARIAFMLKGAGRITGESVARPAAFMGGSDLTP